MGRITRVLKSLGDDSVVPVLVESLKQINNDLSFGARGNLELGAIVYAASDYKPEPMARDIMAMVRETLESREATPDPWRLDRRREDLLGALASLATKSLAPELVGLLVELRDDARLEGWEIGGLIRAITPLADDIETINGLLLMMRDAPNRLEFGLDDEIYNALYTISRRARVRVGSDRQIEPRPA